MKKISREDFYLLNVTIESNGGLKFKAVENDGSDNDSMNNKSTRYPKFSIIEPFEGYFKEIVLKYIESNSYDSAHVVASDSDKKKLDKLKPNFDVVAEHKLSLVRVLSVTLNGNDSKPAVKFKARILNGNSQGFTVETDFISLKGEYYGFEQELQEIIDKLSYDMYDYIVLKIGSEESADLMNPMIQEIKSQLHERELISGNDYRITHNIERGVFYVRKVSSDLALYKIIQYEDSGEHEMSTEDAKRQFCFDEKQFFILTVTDPQNETPSMTFHEAILKEMKENEMIPDGFIIDKVDEGYTIIMKDQVEVCKIMSGKLVGDDNEVAESYPAMYFNGGTYYFILAEDQPDE
jgi:hypothetical protein